MGNVIKSLELPDVTYKLSKREQLPNGHASGISTGQVTIGPLQTNPIEVGRGVICGRGFSNSWHTTIVTKIEMDEHKVIFHTLNSIYELEEYYDSADT